MNSTYSNTPLPKRYLATLLLILSLAGSACHSKDDSISAPVALPASLIGTWQVAEVHTDQGNAHWSGTKEDKYNIYKFLGRAFVLTPQRLTTNAPRDKRCDTPKIIVHHTTAGRVVETSIASRPLAMARPTPKDFQLPLSDDAPVEVLSLICKDGPYVGNLGGDLNPNVGINGAWIIVLNKEEIALRWNDETILVLNRLAENTKPVASFNCAKASSTAEKTICASVPLAAYDQSVAQTYALALEYFKTKNYAAAKVAGFKESQRLWRTQRNACDADKMCLEKFMGDRIVKINYQVASYANNNR